jgi:transcriptional regulator with XRE-family HTH domain
MKEQNTEHPAPARPSRDEPAVGERLRALRELRGHSQRELARLSGVTNGTISMIEQGQVSPSVGSLKKLTDALSLTLAEFFSSDWPLSNGPFFARSQLPRIEGGRIELRMVPAGVLQAQLQVLDETYPPGSDTGPELLSHPGEEAGVVVQGSVCITVGSEERVLSAGDAYYFDSRRPHRFRQVGDEPCRIVSAATPRTF